MNELLILIGCPGSGKSTFAKKLCEKNKNYIHISRDDIRFSLIDPDKEEYFSKEDEVFRIFTNKISNALKQKDAFVIADATHINPASRSKLIYNLDINLNTININYIFFNTPLEDCLKNNEKRKGTKFYVPRGVIKRMHSQLKKPTMEELNHIAKQVITISFPKEEDNK